MLFDEQDILEQNLQDVSRGSTSRKLDCVGSDPDGTPAGMTAENPVSPLPVPQMRQSGERNEMDQRIEQIRLGIFFLMSLMANEELKINSDQKNPSNMCSAMSWQHSPPKERDIPFPKMSGWK